MIQLERKPTTVNIIQVYASTADSLEEEAEKFYDDLENALSITKSFEITIIMGDFNAKVGEEISPVTGNYGLGSRNNRGEKLIEFYQHKDLIIGNTFFKQPKRRLCTWKAPDDPENVVICIQIDYFLVNRRFRNALKSTKTYPGADANTDHILLITTINLKFKRIAKPIKKQRLNLMALRREKTRIKLRGGGIENKIKTLSKDLNDSGSMDQDWELVKQMLLSKRKLEKYLDLMK
ncbi:hypothetical protein PGB90_005351 [Kerria lacca]